MIQVKIAASDGQVMVSVCDQGCGIPADELESVFTRFYRGREQQSSKGHSLGLGLYITKKLVQAQSGEIWAKSEPGRGTDFTFTLHQEEMDI